MFSDKKNEFKKDEAYGEGTEVASGRKGTDVATSFDNINRVDVVGVYNPSPDDTT